MGPRVRARRLPARARRRPAPDADRRRGRARLGRLRPPRRHLGRHLPHRPPPHGTTAGTGWAIRYADCFAGKRVTTTVNEVDSDGSLGIRFNDPNNPQKGGSALNQQFPESLFGNPENGETGALQLDSDEDDANYNKGNPQGTQPKYAYTAWDCSRRELEVKDPTGLAPRKVSVDDPTYNGQTGALFGNYGKTDENFTDEDGNYAWFAGANPTVHDPRDSWADSLNETFRGFRIGGGDENHDTTVGGDCDETADDQDGDNTYSGIHQTAFFYADGNHEGGTQVAAKQAADVEFTYYNGFETDPALEALLGPNTPNSGVATPTTAFLSDPGWSANVVYVTQPQSINRATLQVQGPAYMSFYAKVGATVLDAGWKPTTSAPYPKYGAEACGLNEAGVHNGWQCASDQWYRDSAGNDIATYWEVAVGSIYQFRDIDCNDGTVLRGSGVHASLVDFSAGPELSCRDGPGDGRIMGMLPSTQ